MDLLNHTLASPPITIAVIGCGQRGNAYSRYMLNEPSKCTIVACAEPRTNTRGWFAKQYSIDPTLVFSDWRDLLKASGETIATVGSRLADAVIVAVQDALHREVVVAFAEQGYHILGEKPMATTIEDCIRIEQAILRSGVIFGAGHGSYSSYSLPYTKAITEIVRSNTLGKLVNIQHIEPVGYYHFAHSYVRGNWASEAKSSFVLMTKCCHDIDLLCNWMLPAKPVRVSSFGSLQHFRRSEKPEEAGDATRCLDCPIKNECAYSAEKIYLDPVSRGHTGWPVDVIVDDSVPTVESVTQALETGPYGQCVYESDNDVCDNQVVNIEFSNGATVSFTMVAQTELICERQTRLHFTHGEIVGDMTNFKVTDFATNKTKHVNPPSDDGSHHGGGDKGLALTFVDAVREGKQEVLGTDVTEVLASHLTVFAAERSRVDGKVINIQEFEQAEREKIGAIDG